MQRFRSPAELNDPDWLRAQYASKPGSQIAKELGVSLAAVHKAMHRHGVEADGPWVRRDTRWLRRPARRRLERLWVRHGSIKGVAGELGVAHTTAAVWLADVGIFVRPSPAISGSDLVPAIEAGWSIREIAAEHAVSDRTVMIELRRFGLVEAHRRRPS